MDAAVGRRRQLYLLLLGATVGMLVTGLAVPLFFGEPAAERIARSDIPGHGAFSSGTRTTLGTTGPSSESSGFAPGSAPAGARSVGGEGTVPGRRTGEAGGRAEPGATDRGVTPDTIKIGVLVLDLGGLNAVGISIPGLDPEDQRRAWRAYLEHWNAAGGIGGRKLVAAFRNFDILSHDSMRAACLGLTADEAVFTVFDSAGYWGPAVKCVTVEHRTPYWGIGGLYTPDDYYRDARGYLHTINLSASRMLRNLAWEAHAQGRLSGRTIGIVNDENAGNPQAVDAWLVPALSELGYTVAHRASLSADYGTAASQIPVAMQQMRTRNVDTVLLITNTLYATQVVQNADGQGYRPAWLASDWGAVATNTSSRNMPDSFDGAVAYTVYRTSEDAAGYPEPATDADCRRIYESRTGRSLPYGDSNYNGIVTYCGYLKLWERAVAGAGPQLTRDRWAALSQQIGDAELPVRAPGTLRPGKTDAPDALRTVVWRADCSCWMPVDAFRRARF